MSYQRLSRCLEELTYTDGAPALVTTRRLYRQYGNLMTDRRVVRGITLSRFAKEEEPVKPKCRCSRKKSKYTVRGRNGTPPPVARRRHEPVQTELYLEELYERPLEDEAACQTDLFLDRPDTPPYVPAKTGRDQATAILDGELFDFDAEVVPILEVLVGKTIEQALIEVLEEDEIEGLRIQQREFLELRAAEKAEAQRLEEQETRLRDEKDLRVIEHEEGLRIQRETEKRVAAAMLSEGYLEDLVPDVLEGLEKAGFLVDNMRLEVEECFMPWLMNEVKSELEKMVSSRGFLGEIVREVLEAQREVYTALGGNVGDCSESGVGEIDHE